MLVSFFFQLYNLYKIYSRERYYLHDCLHLFLGIKNRDLKERINVLYDFYFVKMKN